MYKALCVAVLLLCPTLILAQKAKPTTTPFTSPLIVAKGKLRNQTAPIATTTIFTPVQDGLYRLSVYMTQVVSTPNSNFGYFQLSWTDDAGAEQGWNAYLLTTNLAPPQAYGVFTSGLPGSEMVFQSKANTPITYAVFGVGDLGTYSLYFTLERLE